MGNRGVLYPSLVCILLSTLLTLQLLLLYIKMQPFRLLQRYQNVKQELEQQQNLERIRAEKFFKRTFKKN